MRVQHVRVSTTIDTMIPVPVPLTCGYKKYLYPLFADIHLQYPFPTRCEFYLRIPAGTNFLAIPSVGPTYHIVLYEKNICA